MSLIAETVAGEACVISLVTAHMRLMNGRFSELLLVVGSHKPYHYNNLLLTFMAMNEFGEGEVVQQSLIEANGDWHMNRALSHLKDLTRRGLISVIVVDKYLNETRILEANFPDALIQICHLHAIKYLKELRSKPAFVKIAVADASQVDSAIHKMRIGVTFFEYFESTWHTCQDLVVFYLRSSLPYFKLPTNNRLETFFGKLKDSVDRSMSMSQCVKAILAFDHRKQNEYEYRLARIEQFCGSDEEITSVFRFTTDFNKSNNSTQLLWRRCRSTIYSFGRKRYVHLIVDDWSGYITVYLLRHKSESLQMLQGYVAPAENEHGRGTIAVNSDNEGEFISLVWIAYCNKK
ncbi:LOW QUALITY PROTEIN: hypothetical protein PHMEG_00018249 [Phytophthora megakarya]|uniref:ZSWIM1/3 RNaseH-like domain-containing protein n=1 Tax=Phytophthora megakarya TaxID=4795 RepID=A0A225VVS9_9STRA|nr:LOW QUALITY PROTEIN: hypothetical protein PHMEG_00018249 [Phytophthora megakarya]